MKNAVFFMDRDGTINVDIGPEYLSTSDRVQLIPGAGRAIARARKAGVKIAVITNQAGVAKGLTPVSALPLVHGALERLVAEEAGLEHFAFDDIRVCMHHPDQKCACRKPEVKMLEESMAALHADPKRSFFIGDKDSDLECARRLGVRSILVRTGHGKKTEQLLKTSPIALVVGVADSLEGAVELALGLLETHA